MSDPSSPNSSRRRVRATYDAIAEGFAATREYPWPEVTEFVEEQTKSKSARVALDIGCGNGRHSQLLATHTAHVIGVDASQSLLSFARDRAKTRGYDTQFMTVNGDAAMLPLHDDTVDLAVYVATLHHLPTRELRVQSLRELKRVLKSGARGLVSAWSTEHERFGEHHTGFDTTVDWTQPNGETVGRFYHIYAPEEFVADLDRAGLTVVSSVVSSGNCYATVR